MVLPAPTKFFRIKKSKKNICKVCGADKDVWAEVFNEEHHCEQEDGHSN